ncbi:MAG: prepilin-type N-terminal cleavage/methylation domain-containing protein [Candidatus Wildermuthbacteria bacterium]|nr:prepilin-type N-terminal cleavage/methylation domain-containing protein [Candidatus Wildermuthbacteria bacterium]
MGYFKKTTIGFRFHASGFTIPELLVSLFVFSLAILGAVSLLISAIGVQKRAGAQQELMDQASYLAEYMSRALRQARKDLGPTCLSQSGRNYEVSSDGVAWIIDGSGNRMRFMNRNGQCQEFFLDGQRLKERIAPQESYVTSDNLQVTGLGFYISGAGQGDNLQPKATFAIELKGKALQGGFQPVTRMQTTVSQRKIDVPE